ncbi:MAG: GAF domain-containing protein [Armatimonadetes bacterium]|nr:GAF domain-containing protein [Armatimonadota bacterium]
MSFETENRFQLLYRAAQTLHSSLELDVVLERLMDEIVQLTGAERGFILLVETDKDQNDRELAVNCRVGRNLNGRMLDTEDFEYSRHIVLHCLRTREPQLTYDAVQDPRYAASDSVRTQKLRSVLAVPICLRDRLLGVMYVDSRVRTGVFRPADRDTLVALSHLAAGALENARLFSELRSEMLQNLVMKNYQWAILHNVGNGILALDAERRITTSNRAAHEMLGLDPRSVRSRLLSEVLPEAAAAHLEQLLDEMVEHRMPVVRREISFPLNGRGQIFLKISVSPLREPGCHTMGATMVLEDITDVRLAEEARRQEEERRQFVQDLFGRMVSPEVMEELTREPGPELGGRRQSITLMFADINGFTAFCEQRSPAAVIAMLNDYFGVVNEVVFDHRGTVKQFAGDEVMVLFGAPRPDAEHAARAVQTALDLFGRLDVLARTQPPASGFYDIKIGIHTGDTVLGKVGSLDRFEYAAVGDAVNLASRLMKLNRALGTRLLVTDATRRQCSDLPGVDFRSRGEQLIEGRREKVEVFEVHRRGSS